MADRHHTERANFGKLREVIQPPNLIEIQVGSYKRFLQADTAPEKRTPTGLEGLLHMKILRSPHASARIVSIDKTRTGRLAQKISEHTTGN